MYIKVYLSGCILQAYEQHNGPTAVMCKQQNVSPSCNTAGICRADISWLWAKEGLNLVKGLEALLAVDKMCRLHCKCSLQKTKITLAAQSTAKCHIGSLHDTGIINVNTLHRVLATPGL